MENIINPEKKVESTYRTTNSSLPFNLSHPELNLIPYSEIVKVYFNDWPPRGLDGNVFTHAEYVERPSNNGVSYLYVARKGKIGIVKWWYKENIWGSKKAQCQLIIPWKYDRIEKQKDMFVCYKGSDIEYRDLQGEKMR